MKNKVHLLLFCGALTIIAYVCLDYWTNHNAPLYKKFEKAWSEDVDQLEASGKLPRSWYDVHDLTLIGGTPESKDWLARIKVPLKTKPDGHYHMDVLVVAWEEEGKRGTLVQYNVEDLKTKNTIFEIGRTFILSRPKPADPIKAFLEDFKPSL